MRPPTFESSVSDRWAEASVRLCVGLAGAAIVAWGVRHGVYGLLVGPILFFAPFVWFVRRPGWRTAWRVVVSDHWIEATRYGILRVRLPWDGVGEVQHFVRTTTQGPIRVLRLVSIDRQREVIVNDRLPGFDELMGLVETKIRRVNAGTPSSWGRLLWAS